MKVLKASELPEYVGTEIGVSNWMAVPQERIDAFADATEDHQFIHVDPEAAKATPFGGTIAHGFLTLSLLSHMAYEAGIVIEGIMAGVNYGLNRVRFLSPVPSGSKVRGRFTLAEATERRTGQWQLTYTVTVEIDGTDQPALMAEWLVVQMVGAAS